MPGLVANDLRVTQARDAASEPVTVLDFQGDAVTVQEGVLALIRGSSGAGKTTFLRVLAGLTRADRGEVLLDGVDVETMPAADQRRKIAFVAQQAAMLPGTVADNLRVGPTLAGASISDADIDNLLVQVGLSPALARREARELSGGERQRVALCRALALRPLPRALLLDEPTAALDRASAEPIVSLLHQLLDEGVLLVVVTHDEAAFASLPARTYTCTSGRLRTVDEGDTP